jgi:hypothetical protein
MTTLTAVPTGEEIPQAGVPAEEPAEEPAPETDDDGGEEETPAAEAKPPKPMQIPLPGDFSGLNDVAGGAQPTTSEARLLGGSLPIEGQFAGEEVVTLLVTAKVSEVHVVYTTDDWGATKAVKRRHRMRMVSVRRYEP